LIDLKYVADRSL